MSYIYATDGSGFIGKNKSSYKAGAGVVVYNNETKQIEEKIHIAVPYNEITSCILVDYEQPVDSEQLVEFERNFEFTETNVKVNPTNNRGELLGILCALKLSHEYGGSAEILTDSNYSQLVIFGNNYSKYTDEQIKDEKNGDIIYLIRLAERKCKSNGIELKYTKVKAHKTKKEIKTLTGIDRLHTMLNELADIESNYKKN